ncbi:hypothetical protein E2C01_082575 [Portunus trituberculatus]|uniref:Uncharacterized protein n=1 Tax=Portunus trituberculatus TaxID=210409 RepID=A0A5B7IZM7_PORTR|nr:hypothetical protein [Portunus trituberculatus]
MIRVVTPRLPHTPDQHTPARLNTPRHTARHSSTTRHSPSHLRSSQYTPVCRKHSSSPKENNLSSQNTSLPAALHLNLDTPFPPLLTSPSGVWRGPRVVLRGGAVLRHAGRGGKGQDRVKRIGGARQQQDQQQH